MEKYIPYEKLSKKKQRELNAQRRGSWGGINPVTRKPENSKAYNRSKARRWKNEGHLRTFLGTVYDHLLSVDGSSFVARNSAIPG